MTTTIYIMLAWLDRVLSAVRRVFIRQPIMTTEEIEQRIEAGCEEVRQRFEKAISKAHDAAAEHRAAALECQERAAEHGEEFIRYRQEKELLRTLSNMAICRGKARFESCRNRD